MGPLSWSCLGEEKGNLPAGSSFTFGLYVFHPDLELLVFIPCNNNILFIPRLEWRKDISNEFVGTGECYKVVVHLAQRLQKDADLC